MTIESKEYIVATIEPRLRKLENEGCIHGKMVDKEINSIHDCMAEIKQALNDLTNKVTWGILIVIILAFFAGINVWQETLKLVVK